MANKNAEVSKAAAINNASPVIKWPGGKTQLLGEIRKRLPSSFNHYFEPFLGGAAVYLALQPEKSTLNDANPQLINVYRQIRNQPEAVEKELQSLQDGYNSRKDKESRNRYYLLAREKYRELCRKDECSAVSAAHFIFLNKTCFNGLYRENSKGEFNASSGHKVRVNAFDPENLRLVSRHLQSAELITGDFEDACKGARKGDFVFFDSPYYDTFDTYRAGGFSDDDHRRLASLVRRLTKKGVKCMLTNSNTDFIRDLYKDCFIETVPVRRSICRDGKKRTDTEIIITNYRTA